MTSPFDDLLAPFPSERFFAEVWRQSSLHVPGDAAKFGHLPGLAEIPGLLAGKLSETGWAPGVTKAAPAHLNDAQGVPRPFAADPAMWSRLYNLGTTFCFPVLDDLDDRLKSFVAAFRSTTPLVGDIYTNGYLTPPNAGSKLHFDSQDVFFLQISGEKHWKVGARPAWRAAPVNMPAVMLAQPELMAFLRQAGVQIAAPDADVVDLVLRPGDVLYLPPGTWHHGHTEDSHSLHYTLTFAPIDPWAVFFSYLRLQLLGAPAWREDLRYATAREASPDALLLTALEQLRASLARATPEQMLAVFRTVTASRNEDVRRFFMTPH